MNNFVRNLMLGALVAQSAIAHAVIQDMDSSSIEIYPRTTVGPVDGFPVRNYAVNADAILMAVDPKSPDLVALLKKNPQTLKWKTAGVLSRTQPAVGYKEQDISNYEEEFGRSIAIDGNRIAVGAPDWDNDAGSVYVFTRNAETGEWLKTARIHEKQDGFGLVSLKGNLMAVSSFDMRDNVVHVYRYTNNQWNKEAELRGDEYPYIFYQGFGRSIDVDGTRIAVGAHEEGEGNGAAYIFKHSDGAWLLEQKITSPGARYFGISLDLNGKSLVVGAPGGANHSRPDSHSPGSVHFFHLESGVWTETAELIPKAAYGSSDLFGYSVQLSSDGFIAVGAPEAKDERYDVDGSIYLFKKINDSNWKQVLHISDKSTGNSVRLRNGYLFSAGEFPGFNTPEGARSAGGISSRYFEQIKKEDNGKEQNDDPWQGLWDWWSSWSWQRR